MTFEERMDRLTERHEALAQSVEMHQHMLEGILTTMREQNAAMREQNAAMHEQRMTTESLRETLHGLMSATSQLIELADRHEGRIHKLEQGA